MVGIGTEVVVKDDGGLQTRSGFMKLPSYSFFLVFTLIMRMAA